MTPTQIRDIAARALAVIETSEGADEHAELRAELAAIATAEIEDDEDPYPGQIRCPDERCPGIADAIGDDCRGREYYACPSCGNEWIFGPTDPELQRLPDPG